MYIDVYVCKCIPVYIYIYIYIYRYLKTYLLLFPTPMCNWGKIASCSNTKAQWSETKPKSFEKFQNAMTRCKIIKDYIISKRADDTKPPYGRRLEAEEICGKSVDRFSVGRSCISRQAERSLQATVQISKAEDKRWLYPSILMRFVRRWLCAFLKVW